MVKSIQELIDMKEEINKKKNEIKTIYISSLDTEVKYKLATRTEMVNISKMDLADQDSYLVYTHVVEPNFKDKQLQEVFNKGNQPHCIIDKMIIKAQEVAMLSNAIAGQNQNVNIVKDLKN